MGFDNYLYPGLCDVEITTYEVDMKEMARKGINTLIKKMGNESYKKGVSVIEVQHLDQLAGRQVAVAYKCRGHFQREL